MAFAPINPIMGLLPIANTDAGFTTANGSALAVPTLPAYPGMIIQGQDPTFGMGEFILLKGVASTAIGSVVTYNATTFQTTLVPVTSNLGQPVAVAMSANLAATWGWYQISGTAVAAKSTSSKFLATVALGIISTGKVGSVSSGKQILGARTANAATVASATTTVQVMINRPHCQGRVT